MLIYQIGSGLVSKYLIQVNILLILEINKFLLYLDIKLSLQVKNQTQTDLENLILKVNNTVHVFLNNKFYFKNILPQIDSTQSSKDEQWKALLTKQTIVIDADIFKGLCKKNSFEIYLSIVILHCSGM